MTNKPESICEECRERIKLTQANAYTIESVFCEHKNNGAFRVSGYGITKPWFESPFPERRWFDAAIDTIIEQIRKTVEVPGNDTVN